MNPPIHRGLAVAACLLSLHERPGRSIAYARSNGVVPPWNR